MKEIIGGTILGLAYLACAVLLIIAWVQERKEPTEL